MPVRKISRPGCHLLALIGYGVLNKFVQISNNGPKLTQIYPNLPNILFLGYLIRENKTDGANSEFSGARWRPRTGDFTTYTVLSFEAS